MIGLDTNILLRLWLDDDQSQSGRVQKLLEEHGNEPASLLVTDVSLVEAMWTLRKGLRYDKASQLTVLRGLLGEVAFTFEDRDAIAAAVDMFESHPCGFSDCLVAVKHASQGCEFSATFDRGMRKLPGIRVI